MNYKETATKFLELCAVGKPRIAFEKFAGPGFIHHNAFFKGDANSLIVAMEESEEKFPDKVLTIQHALGDENIVAIHSHVKMMPEDPGYAVMHIFRFEKDKVVELWDFSQQVPENCVNENGMF